MQPISSRTRDKAGRSPVRPSVSLTSLSETIRAEKRRRFACWVVRSSRLWFGCGAVVTQPHPRQYLECPSHRTWQRRRCHPDRRRSGKIRKKNSIVTQTPHPPQAEGFPRTKEPFALASEGARRFCTYSTECPVEHRGYGGPRGFLGSA